MNDQLRNTAEKLHKEYLRKKHWKKVVKAMGCVVVFCTTYALILPAITMQKDTICGYEEHLHGDECYIPAPTVEMICTAETLGVHEHDDDCYDEENELICGQADFIIHEHDDDCYWEDELLLCTLDEVEEHTHSKKKCYDIYEELACGQEETGHFHGEACYASERGELSCGVEESEGHSHSGGCYEFTTVTKTSLACGSEEEGHSHDDGCYETTEIEERELICTEKEYKGHSHNDSCYEWNKYLTCTREEVDGHIHDDSCYVTVEELDCDKEEIEAHEHDEDCNDCKKLETIEHQHSEACFRELAEEEVGEPILICKEKQHQHTDDCYPKETELVFVCELMEHCHEDFCYDTEGNLICEITEHSHDDSCYEEVEIGGEPGGADKEIEGEADETDKPDNSDGTESPTEGETDGTIPEEPPVTGGKVDEDTPAEDSKIEELPPAEDEQEDSDINSSGGSNHSSNKDKDKDDQKDETIEEPKKETEGEDTEGNQPDIKDDSVIKEDGEVEVPEDDPADPEIQEPQENPMFPVFPEEEPVKQPEVEINGLQKHEHGEDCYDEEGNLSCTIQDVMTEPKEEITKEELEEIEIPTLSEFAQMGNIEIYLQDQMGNLRFRILNGTGEGLMPDENGVYFVDTETEYSLHVGILAPQGFEEGSYFYQLPEGVNSETGNGVLMIEEVEVGNWVVTDSGYITFFMNQEAKKYWDVSISIDIDITFDAGMEECQIGDLMLVLETTVDDADRRLSASTENADITVVVSENIMLPEGAYLDVTELSEDSLEGALAAEKAEEMYPKDYVLGHNLFRIVICDEDGFELSGLTSEDMEISITLKDVSLEEAYYQPMCIYPEEIKNIEDVEMAKTSVSNAVSMAMLSDEAEEPVLAGNVEQQTEKEDVLAEEVILDKDAELTAEFVDAVTIEGDNFVTMEFTTVTNAITVDAVALSSTLKPGTYSGMSFDYIDEKNAFTRNPDFADYYNENSPLGVAGSFHLVGFDTVEFGCHVNGNILAKKLKAGSNFGTKGIDQELTYVQNYEKPNNQTEHTSDKNILVVGSSNTMTLKNDRPAVNDMDMIAPKTIYQEENTMENPFIDLERVENEIRGISASLKKYSTSSEEILQEHIWKTDQNNRDLTLVNPDALGVYNFTGSELNDICNTPLRLKGFTKGGKGSIVINVDCSDIAEGSTITMPQAPIFVDGNQVNATETLDFTDGRILWNFINADGKKIWVKYATGMIVAPGAHVELHESFNGTVVAEKINVYTESHRTDFSGKLVHTTTEFSLRKVDSENISIVLPDAVFDLYKWDGSDYVKVNTDPNQYTSAANGLISFPDLEYNTAYKLVETTSPIGYIIGDEPYYIILEHSDIKSYPVCKPSDFTGSDPGSLLYVRNEASDGGYELPSTGGMGTHWFILGGLTMMFGAGARIIKKQRSKSEENS